MKMDGRKLRLELLETRNMLAVYAHSAAGDFAADFSGGLPQNNPNGDWAYLATDGTTTSLIATNGSSPVNTFGIGAGWAQQSSGIPSYARGGPLGLPTGTIAGHGPQKVVWTAPIEVDMGAVELSGELTQLAGQPLRQMQMRIFKNSNPNPFLIIEADPNAQIASYLPPSVVAIKPGDTLSFVIDGNGSQGNGVSTFSAWDIDILEVDPAIDADFDGDFAVGELDLAIWQTGFGLASGATPDDGDADGDSDVDGSDFLIWQRQLGNNILSGSEIATPPFPPYHPTAVIVQTSGVTLPDGTALNISGTQTQGLQEAFNYAADGGWGVFVLPGTYTLDVGLDVVQRQGFSFRLQDVTMNFGDAVTDFGLRFDSTMIGDWYWDGGALNAPHATDGVRFDSRNLHPLDGCLGITPPATVDSRFIFDVPITAATNKVTMDSTNGTINDIYLHFQGLAENQLNYIGNRFADTNTFVDARTDPAIPWDIFSTEGRVTVNVPDGPIGTIARVYLPDGSLLDTSGTSTSGLQEAFDFAAANDLDVLVFGRGIVNSEINPSLPFCGNTNQGLYNLSDTLTVGSLNDRMYRIFNVTFNYTGSGTALVLNDVVSSDFELTGQVVAINATTGVLIQPLTTPITNSTIRVEHVPIINDAPGTTGVLIDPSLQTIENSKFYFNEILGGEVGLQVNSPSETTFFQNNVVSTIHNHDWKSVGLKLGEGAVSSDNIHSNTIDIHTNTDGGPADLALQVWGDNNTFTFSANGGGSGTIAARFESTSESNVVTHFAVNGTIVNLGINNSFMSGMLQATDSSTEERDTRTSEIMHLAGIQFGSESEKEQSPQENHFFSDLTPILSQSHTSFQDADSKLISERDSFFSDLTEDSDQLDFSEVDPEFAVLALELASSNPVGSITSWH